MSSKSETGHAVNVTNLEKLNSYSIKLGILYDPSNIAISTANVTAEIALERTALKKVNAKSAPWVTAVNERVIELDPLDKLMTQVLNEVIESDIPAEYVADVKSRVRKIQGVRISPKIVFEPGDPGTPTDESVKQISASQTGIDNRLNHLDELIQLLTLITNYNPNQAALKITALTALHTSLTGKNSAVISALPDLDIARAERDDCLYHKDKNGAELASKIKAYYKATYGAGSKHYKNIAGLKFTKPRK